MVAANIILELLSLKVQNFTIFRKDESNPLGDNLTSWILKELHNEIAPILTNIFNSSLSEGTVPKDWKKAYVTPVYKKDPNQNQKTTALYP